MVSRFLGRPLSFYASFYTCYTWKDVYLYIPKHWAVYLYILRYGFSEYEKWQIDDEILDLVVKRRDWYPEEHKCYEEMKQRIEKAVRKFVEEKLFGK